MCNVCMCGAGAGYRHAATCPYPIYRGTVEMEDKWLAEEQKLIEAQEPSKASNDDPGYIEGGNYQ